MGITFRLSTLFSFQRLASTISVRSKSIKKVRDIKNLKSTSVESNWPDYTGSSKCVNEMIEAGMPYTKKDFVLC